MFCFKKTYEVFPSESTAGKGTQPLKTFKYGLNLSIRVPSAVAGTVSAKPTNASWSRTEPRATEEETAKQARRRPGRECRGAIVGFKQVHLGAGTSDCSPKVVVRRWSTMSERGTFGGRQHVVHAQVCSSVISYNIDTPDNDMNCGCIPIDWKVPSMVTSGRSSWEKGGACPEVPRLLPHQCRFVGSISLPTAGLVHKTRTRFCEYLLCIVRLSECGRCARFDMWTGQSRDAPEDLVINSRCYLGLGYLLCGGLVLYFVRLFYVFASLEPRIHKCMSLLNFDPNCCVQVRT